MGEVSEVKVKWKSLSHVQHFVTPWTEQFMEFSRPEYWMSSLLFRLERGPGIALQARQEKKALSSRGRGQTDFFQV